VAVRGLDAEISDAKGRSALGPSDRRAERGQGPRPTKGDKSRHSAQRYMDRIAGLVHGSSSVRDPRPFPERAAGALTRPAVLGGEADRELPGGGAVTCGSAVARASALLRPAGEGRAGGHEVVVLEKGRKSSADPRILIKDPGVPGTE
jgi:hypothetical protein